MSTPLPYQAEYLQWLEENKHRAVSMHDGFAAGVEAGVKKEASERHALRDEYWGDKVEAAYCARDDAKAQLALAEERALLARELAKALKQSENTIRSLISTLETMDSDERYKAREEKRSAYVHTREIKQSTECMDQARAALATYEGEKLP